MTELQSALKSYKAGDKVTLTVAPSEWQTVRREQG